MIITCAWHYKYFGKVKFLGQKEPLSDTTVTHGICHECQFRVVEDTEINRRKSAFDREWDAFNKIKL